MRSNLVEYGKSPTLIFMKNQSGALKQGFLFLSECVSLAFSLSRFYSLLGTCQGVEMRSGNGILAEKEWRPRICVLLGQSSHQAANFAAR
jgi:hypothetical protein